MTLLTEALSPTNTLLGNPAALKRAFDTAGRSLLDGLRNYLGDLINNGAMPSQVDKRTLRGRPHLAVTPGAVVHRGKLVELIQYKPATAQVYERPVMLTARNQQILRDGSRAQAQLHRVCGRARPPVFHRELAQSRARRPRHGPGRLRQRVQRGLGHRIGDHRQSGPEPGRNMCGRDHLIGAARPSAGERRSAHQCRDAGRDHARS